MEGDNHNRRRGIKRQRSFSLPTGNVNLNIGNAVKLKQILDYNHTEEKLSKLLGIDAPTVREMNSAHHEDQLHRERALGATSQDKRNAKKALAMLGHDLSREKVKKTLGIDDKEIEKEKTETVRHYFHRKRASSAPTMDKRHAVKALSTLGLDISAKKAMQVLGLEEEVVKEAYEAEIQRQEERISRQRETSATRNKKGIQKALNVIGYNPSLEKVMDTLGVEIGSDAESALRTVIPAPSLNSSHVVGKYSNKKHSNGIGTYLHTLPPYVVVMSVGVLLFVVTSVARKVN